MQGVEQFSRGPLLRRRFLLRSKESLFTKRLRQRVCGIAELLGPARSRSRCRVADKRWISLSSSSASTCNASDRVTSAVVIRVRMSAIGIPERQAAQHERARRHLRRNTAGSRTIRVRVRAPGQRRGSPGLAVRLVAPVINPRRP
jgi:hypothetical protein